ncbi:MAG: hypothetical protein KJ000_25165 [Pirellulaceae bacterium]|nr:hypothetical protein [Pirellulaceae bacterium]
MEVRDLTPEDRRAAEQALGYLNFSSGAPDPRFLASLNHLFASALSLDSNRPPWTVVLATLEIELARLAAESTAFRDAEQARAVLRLVSGTVLPGYLEFHRDLLFHQNDATLFNSFFLGRVCEAVLRQEPPWDDPARIASVAIQTLCDYIGHRPVAVLESQRMEPYAHEWVRPVPLYVRDAGVAVGGYREVVETALRLLAEASEDILREACFDPGLLDELAFDPRAYDFDHPVNKRPNYHFGQWDPNLIDNQGFYRRYVAQQVTLDALTSRLTTCTDTPHDELVFEAAAVLAGTIIMSTGISGSGPGSHDSTVTLTTLLPRIAAYRDAFYERLLGRLTGRHGERLRREAEQRRQPFGGARQHLNGELARRRAAQLEHVHLAAIFARMGYPDAAVSQADVVPAVSARMLCQIDCRLTEGDLTLNVGDLPRCARLVDEIMEWIHRGIQCGAIVDPWNILGFDGNFSLFPASENSVRDHRIDELVTLMEQVFGLYSRLWSEAAARNDGPLCEQVSARFRDTATWWRRYAAHEVSSVEAIDVDEAYESAERVAHALNLWHRGGAAAEDVRFWAPHADMFDSPKAYGLVIANLLERGGLVTSMALMMHWLEQAARIGLEKGDTSFFELAERWIYELRRRSESGKPDAASVDAWSLACKFLERLEANADEYWDVPSFELARDRNHPPRRGGFIEETDEDDEDENENELYRAAREGVTFVGSTDDGFEGSVADEGPVSDDELYGESKRLSERLLFLSLVARLWQLAVTCPSPSGGTDMDAARREVVSRWIDQASTHREQLRGLVDEIAAFRLPSPSGDHDSMVQYDRIRMIKETMLDNAIASSVDMVDACRVLAATTFEAKPAGGRPPMAGEYGEDELKSLPVLAAIFQGNPQEVRRGWEPLVKCLRRLPLLYVPLAKEGNPHDLVTAKARQHMIQSLLAWLPRLGLVFETCQLIETAREMERQHPVGPGAVTEFDELFKIGYKSLVRTIIRAASEGTASGATKPSIRKREGAIVDCLKQLTESLLSSWLAHSRTLRLSVLERLKDKDDWQELVAFIEHYGADIFTQRFLNLSNLRAILHRGVRLWLQQLVEDENSELEWRLLDDLQSGRLSPDIAQEYLSLVLEAIVENYGEYRDYNSMTTQSDRGELLYMLLDFLRLRTQYDRICWQLKPVVWAHELLVRRGQKQAAEIWRREFSEQTREQADRLLERLAALQKKYAMRMPTVADRLGERFVRPMAIDRIRALVGPAMEECRVSTPSSSFELLQQETDLLTREPSGVGLDVPAWLVALEEEVAETLQQEAHWNQARQLEVLIPRQPLTLQEARRQLERWRREWKTRD